MDPIWLTYEQQYIYYWSREGSGIGVNICVSMALTLLLTLNDINKPINRFITLNVVRKWRYLSSYVKRVKVLFW